MTGIVECKKKELEREKPHGPEFWSRMAEKKSSGKKASSHVRICSLALAFTHMQAQSHTHIWGSGGEGGGK